MFRKFFILFLACFFVATVKTSDISQADNGYQIARKVQKKKVVKKKATKKSTNRSQSNAKRATVVGGGKSRNRNVTRKVSKKTKTTSKNRNTGNNFYKLATEKEIAQTTNAIEDKNAVMTGDKNNNNVVVMTTYDNSYYLPDDFIISTMDEQEELHKKRENDGKKREATNKTSKNKLSFRDRFYTKHNLYVGYAMDNYKSSMFSNLTDIPNNYSVNSKEVQNKARSLVFGMGENFYFKINNTFHPFVGIDFQFKNNSKMKAYTNYNSHIKTLPLDQTTAQAYHQAMVDADNMTDDEIKAKIDAGIQRESIDKTTVVDFGVIKNITNSVVLQDYGSFTGKLGMRINFFKKNILSISPYGIFGFNFTKLKTSNSPYNAGDCDIPVYIPEGSTGYVAYFGMYAAGGMRYGTNVILDDLYFAENKKFFSSFQNIERKTNKLNKIFGAGIDFTIVDIFTFGIEYRISERNMSGIFFEGIANTTLGDVSVYTARLQKVKIHSLVAKFGVQF